jgi:putative SOS response-associated peptidase YedK
MPVILDPEDESKWLSDTPMNIVMSMLRSYPAEKMNMYPISNLVNIPTNNSVDIIKPLN